MVYKKNYKRRVQSKSWYDTKLCTSPKGVAMTALKGVQYLKGLVNAEKKYRIFEGTSFPDNSGLIIPLHAIATGDLNTQRTGNSILSRGLDCRFDVLQNSTAARTTHMTLIILQDTQQIADTSPAITSILADTSPLSGFNTDSVGRFKILYRRQILLSKGIKEAEQFHKFIPLMHHIRYNGNGIADIQRGGLYMYLVSNETVSTPPDFNYNIRISFYDN